MQDVFSYSIVIRTLGNTGEKYRMMLDCISGQTVKPEEVIVVIPRGYELDYALGYERVVRSEKGMVTQRAVGIEEAKSDYILVLDDDLAFPSDFAEKMFLYLHDHQLDCTLAFGGWGMEEINGNQVVQPAKNSVGNQILQRLEYYRGGFTGQHFESKRSSDYFDVVTTTAGHRTYENSPCGLCSTGCFQCFLMKTEIAKQVMFYDEIWLEQGTISKYAAYDDMCFFYKAFLQGARIAYANTTDYHHLDASAGRPAKSKLEAKRIRLYTIARNRTIFWYKFLWKESNTNSRKVHVLCGGLYAIVNYSLYSIIVNISPRYWRAIEALWCGYRDAFHYIKNRKS